VHVVALELLARRTSESAVMRVTSTVEVGRSVLEAGRSALVGGTKPSSTTRPSGWRQSAAAARQAPCTAASPMLQNVL
jgi:hypothetical protein